LDKFHPISILENDDRQNMVHPRTIGNFHVRMKEKRILRTDLKELGVAQLLSQKPSRSNADRFAKPWPMAENKDDSNEKMINTHGSTIFPT
jgi:hypothetical protein